MMHSRISGISRGALAALLLGAALLPACTATRITSI